MKAFVPWFLLMVASPALAERTAQLVSDRPHGSSHLLGSEPASTSVGFAELFAKTSAVGVVASTTGVLLGAGLGSLSNNLIGAALPVLLSNLFVPPVLTVLAALLMANWNEAGRVGFWLPMLGAFVVNAAVYVLASFAFVVPWTNPVALLLYSLVDGLLMSGATVGVMALTERRATSTVSSFVPGVSETTFLPLVKVDL